MLRRNTNLCIHLARSRRPCLKVRPGDLPCASALLTNSVPEFHLGPVDPATVSQLAGPSQAPVLRPMDSIPISMCLNLDDMERAAQKTLSRRAWTYFHSAADSLESMRSNVEDWKKVSFRPRVLRNVARVSARTHRYPTKTSHRRPEGTEGPCSSNSTFPSPKRGRGN